MDPATAFSVVCGVVQLIEFGLFTASKFREIYKSSSALTAEADGLHSETSRLDRATSSLATRLSNIATVDSLTHDQKRLRQIALECNKLSQHLLSRLDKLKISGPLRKRDVPAQWMKIMRERDNIDKTQGQLNRMKDVLDTQMLVNLCHDMDVNDDRQKEILLQIDLLQLQSFKTFKDLQTTFQKLVRDVETQIESIKDHVTNEEEQTRILIRDLDTSKRQREDIDRVLQSLAFDAMNARQEEIPDAYSETFRWIFNTDLDTVRPWSNFVDWLVCGEEVYWINGKAGSGKSTLMNFIAENDNLKPLLKQWAGKCEVLIPKFFFWRPGSVEQKSINGLLRALLHQMISYRPSCFNSLEIETQPILQWTDRRLETAIKKIMSNETGHVKACFLIDGLDEFEGDEDSKSRLMAFIIDTIKNDGVKAVISSRPEPFLIDSLSRFSQLRLQDLTISDIRAYVEGKLLSEGHMCKLCTEAPKTVNSLVREVCKKADGVFLWAHLAVQDLLGGIRARDSLVRLQERVSLLDRSLDGLFSQLLGRIHPVHQHQAANFFHFVTKWKVYHDCGESLALLHVAFAFCEDLSSYVRSLSDCEELQEAQVDQFRQYLEDFRISLLSQTAGLLEVIEVECVMPDCSTLLQSKSSSTRLAAYFIHYLKHVRISFVHRSAYEFLTVNKDGKELLLKGWKSEEHLDSVAVQAVQDTSESILFWMEDRTISLPTEDGEFQCDELHCHLQMIAAILRMMTSYEDAAARRCRFDAISKWFKTNMEIFLQILEDRARDNDELWICDGKFVKLGCHVQPDALLLVYLINSQAFQWVLDNLNYQDQKTLQLLMKTIAIRCWRYGFLGEELVVRLLESGIDANSTETKPSSQQIFSALNPRDVIDCGYSVWVWFLYYMLECDLDEVHHEESWELFISVAEAFVAHNADVNIAITASLECLTDLSECRSMLEFTVELRALDAIELFCNRCGIDATRIQDQMMAKGAVSCFEVTGVNVENWRGGTKGSSAFKLVIPNRGQHEKLSHAVKELCKTTPMIGPMRLLRGPRELVTLGDNKCSSTKTSLLDAVAQTMEENEEHVTKTYRPSLQEHQRGMKKPITDEPMILDWKL